MPKNTQRTLGLSPAEVLVNSGGEQFFLFGVSDSPATVHISFAQLPDGSQFAGQLGFAGNPSAFTTSSYNYIWYRISTDVLESNDTGFANDTDTIPLWEIYVDASGVVTNTFDRRAWFGGSGGGGANSVEERLKEILHSSVMEFGLIDPLLNVDDVDSSNSTGTFLAQSEYQLSAGDVLQSNFTSAPPEAPSAIEQATVSVLSDEPLSVGDLQIYLSRTPSPSFPGDFELVSGNFNNHIFTGSGTNVLNIRIVNNSASDITISGYGIYYNNIGGPTGVLGGRDGSSYDSSGLNVYNRNLSYAVDSENTGTPAGQGTIRWRTSAVTASGTDEFEILSPGVKLSIRTENGVHSNIISSGTISNFLTNTYVYADLDLDSPGSAITMQSSVGAPNVSSNRVLLAARNTSGVYWIPGNKKIESADTNQLNEALPGNLSLGVGIRDGLTDPSGIRGSLPSSTNPFATMSDTTGIFPISPESNQTIRTIGIGASWTGVIDHINFSAEGVTIPAGATHAQIRVVADMDAGSFSGGNFEVYVARYNGGAVDSTHNIIGVLSLGSGNNQSMEGSRLVELNSPPLTFDITVQFKVISSPDTTSGYYNVYVEYFRVG